MEFVTIKGLPKKVSRLILGCDWKRDMNQEEIFQLIDDYVAIQGNTIDTARVYAKYKSEAIIGEWFKRHPEKRDQMVIVTKACHHWVDEEGTHYPEHRRVSADILSKDLKKSLEELGVPTIDILLLHRDDHTIPVELLMDCFEAHRLAGEITVYGVSNWTIPRIEAANAYCASKGYLGIVVNSPSFSLATVREPRWVGCIHVPVEDLEWCDKHEIVVSAWSPQACGYFGDIFNEDRPAPEDFVKAYDVDINKERKERAKQLGAKKGVSPMCIALAYILSQPYPLCAVTGATRKETLTENLSALSLKLTPEELKWLEEGDDDKKE